MGKTRSMIRTHNHDDASNRKRFKTCDINGGATSWSDLEHAVLFKVMMQLGCIDFVAFSEVCKSWRSFAVSKKKMFMASRPPMLMWVLYHPDKINECYLEDFEGRKFKTLFPHSAHRKCVGLTCGSWNHVSSTFPILDLHAFKGKIYALNNDFRLCEMNLNPQHPKLTLLKIKNCLKPCFFHPKFVSLAGEKLYVIDHIPEEDEDLYRVQELDFGKMKWVLQEEKTIGEEYAFFLSILWNDTAVNYGATVKLDLCAKIYDCFPGIRKDMFFATKNMWYFPHECMKVNRIDES
ncbi:unnamed protein product [Lactuca virosa]|uniref:F-box domain-containing protein n=1 Tax=Lactuca virosa TaxID=75947 RepID=A0AAU9LQR2_9ASTR|nr:unnamed protein product [Lactuca virosa]